MSRTICLDAGHYGKYNCSPAVASYYESDMNWKLHLLLKKELESYGFKVTQTRSTQAKDLGLYERGAASKGCDLFLSIHSNAVGSSVNESVDYPLVIVQLDGKGNALGKKIASCIKSTMATKQDAQVITKKGNNGEYYGVLRGAAAVGTMGMILEHSFHTNTRSTKWLLQDSNLAKLAAAEAAIIAAHFGMNKKADETSTNKEETTVNIEMTILKNGAKGYEVKTLQRLLLALGFKMTDLNGKEYAADGSFGGATERAVNKYKKSVGLSQNGIVDAATWNKLLKG